MKEINYFSSAIEFINWLMHHESQILCDSYGRQWKYERFTFYFKDIGSDKKMEEGIKCTHLFSTVAIPKPQEA
jgi:hypothetical protein